MEPSGAVTRSLIMNKAFNALSLRKLLCKLVPDVSESVRKEAGAGMSALRGRGLPLLPASEQEERTQPEGSLWRRHRSGGSLPSAGPTCRAERPSEDPAHSSQPHSQHTSTSERKAWHTSRSPSPQGRPCDKFKPMNQEREEFARELSVSLDFILCANQSQVFLRASSLKEETLLSKHEPTGRHSLRPEKGIVKCC